MKRYKQKKRMTIFLFRSLNSIDVLDQEKQPGSGSGKILTVSGSMALEFTYNIWYPKYENKKVGVKSFLQYSFNRILKISLRSRYRALNPKFAKNRILAATAILNYILMNVRPWLVDFSNSRSNPAVERPNIALKNGTIQMQNFRS